MSWEEYKKKREEKTSWEQYKQDRQEKIANNIRAKQSSTNQTKSNSLWDDILGIAKITGISGKTGIEQMLKKTELDMENTNSSYKNRVRNQFLSNPKISDVVKAEVKNNNIVTNRIKTNTNLPTISDIIGKTNKEEQEKIENKVQNNINQYKNADGKIETNLVKQGLQNAIDKDNKKIAETAENMSNNVTKYIASNLAPSIGQMGVGAVMSAINPAYGALYFTQSAGGSYYDDAKQKGMNDDEALKYGTIMGAVEGVTELIGLKQFSKAGKTVKTLIKGTGKELAKEGLEQTSKATLKTALKEYGIGIADNIMQEAIIEPIQELTSHVVAGKDKANWDNIGQRMLQSGINGGLVSAIVGGSNLGIQSCTAIVEKANKGQTITEQEFKQAVNEASKKLDVPKMIVDNTQQQINKYRNNTSNSQSQSTQNQQILPTQQINQEQNKMAQNGNMKSILPVQRYVYEKSDNVKVDNFRQDASKYWDNSEKTRNYMNMLEKIIQDKDIEIRLDANLKDSKGNLANGSYSNGVITINPNSTRAGEFIAIHELTHAIGTNQMRNIVEKYRKNNKEFDSAVEQLLKNYKSTELTEEAMADVAGQLFGNQEFINNLAQTEPSLFQKIYNEIKYLWHQFTGYKNQDQFINDLQYKWEQAYRSNAKLNETTNYSIAGRKALENIKSDRVLYNQAIKNYNLARNMAKHGRKNAEIMEKTGWFKDDTGKLKFSFSDKDMDLKNIRFQEDIIYNLEDILEHDTLFTFYPELRKYKVEFKDLNKGRKKSEGYLSGSFSRINKGIRLDIYRANSKIDTEGTLIHEIQHAIQNIEGFRRGTTTKKGKKQYQRSLGEIEARDTTRRFINEKYNGLDMSNILPESATFDRNMLDKMKDALYNYLNKFSGGVSNEEIIETNKETTNRNRILVDGRINDIENSGRGSFNLPKIKEGYTRLYRGLENEYDANYDKSKLDNSNGYESWTDDYELAKAYGDNVYYIDIPSNEIKDSIIDEDSQSETYGDRNLLYKNDKPVGIKGKSGNEYMLYTDHDNYSNLKYNKVNSNNFAQDNQGRTLSKEQQEYFKDSKVRDENGNLLTMYHGTPNGNHTVFRDGSYFSPRKEYADGYQNTWASAISTKQNVNNPKTYEVYLNITNPFTLQDSKAKNIYLNEFIKGGNSLSYDPYTDWTNDINNLDEIDWTEAEDLREWLVENHPEYDGLILDEGGDGGYGEAEYRWRGKSFVPFNSNQIKNVDNTNPTSNPDIRYSLPTKNWQQYLEDNYKSTGTRTNLQDIKLPTKQEKNMPVNEEKRVAQILEKPVQKVKEKDRSWAIIKANLIDKGMVFEELSRKTGNRDLQGKYDYTLTAQARGQNAIGNARYELDSKTKTQKQISKSLTDIIDEVGENTADFYDYMYHQLNIDRMTLEDRFGGDTGINYERKNEIKNKPVFGESVTAQMSREKVQELEKKYPKFKEYAQDVYDYLDANTKELVNNGVISKETQELFKEMYPHYVPISRVNNKGMAVNVPLDTGRTGINSPIKKATGGSSDINPLFETMADRTLQTYRASARNNFGVELKKTLSKTNELNQITQQSDIDTIMEQMTDEKQNNQLLQEGKNGENPTFTVFENGNKVTYEISKDMYDALKPKNELLSKIDDNKFSKMANKINNFRRGLLTEYNPIFSLTNAIKDSQDILLNSQHSAKTYSKIPEATAQILSKGYWYNEYMQNGGAQNSYFKDGEFEVTKNNVPTKIKNAVTFPLRAISNVNNVIEMTPRLAEYIVSREQGKSIETSMLDASRVTTNFKAGGDITKTLNRNGFTFLNASVQGMQQQIRNIQEANAKGLKGYAVLACKYAIAGVPVLLLNNLIWDDDEEYNELQDYVKDNYYIIGKLSNGKFLRIPKGRAVATIQKIVSNANDFIKNDTINSDEVGKIFWKDMKENIQFGIDNLAPNNPMENNIISPVFQAITNKTWYGEDLVPTRLQNKPKAEQYDETTDKFSRWLGEKTGMSPIKINYLIDQYSGGVGDILLPLGTPQAENNVIEDKFTTDSTMKSKYPGEFFSKVDELEINSNSSKATDEDIIKYKYISSISSEIGKLYKKKREIQNSNGTDEKKKSQLKEVQKQINEMAKNSLENVDKITKGEKYAQIDKNQYYKDVEGEWQKVTDKDKEKNKKSELSLKTYSSYKYQMSKVKQQKVNKGEMTKDQSLKNDDKIQILLNSNYSDKEKRAIYENYIKTQTKNGEYDSFDVIKASNIDIDEYLKFEQQDFASDKKDDGTLDGKTVNNSKKQKVINYIRTMKIEENQRLLLYAMQGYDTTSSQKTQLAQYVYNLKLKPNTKLELYNKFSGFKVYKDGRVKW